MRWCNKIGQFDLLNFCARKEWPRSYRIVKWLGKGEKLRRYKTATLEDIVPEFWDVLLVKIRELETKRQFKPFMKRGEWMVCSHPSDNGIIKESVETDFDKSIITWHIATKICYKTKPYKQQSYCKASMIMSSYMMYLLVEQPHTLSLNTSDLTLSDACMLLKVHLKSLDYSVDRALDDWYHEGLERHENNNDSDKDRPMMMSVIGKNWHLVKDAGKLAMELKGRNNTWELIGTFWVEMICFTAFNCPLSNHARLLRQGGDIITHVWLLLAHKTDKHNAIELPSESNPIDKSSESTLIDIPIENNPSRRT
ncbi:hypothetical protein MLD38_015283 [Melastoma candidum]|nr:hypothetical protein MLD38_015283 [Melastoma candidum]